MYRRIRPLCLILTALLLLLPLACSAASDEDLSLSNLTEKTEIVFLTTNSSVTIDKYNTIFESIMKKYPNLEIKFHDVATSSSGYGWDGLNQKFVALLAAGNAPDLMFMGVSWLPQYAANGYLTQLDEYIDKYVNEDEYVPDAFRLLKYVDGNTYAVPSGLCNVVMYYNKNMFDAVGLSYPSSDWKNPMTMDEFIDAAKKLTIGEGAAKKFGVYANLHPERSVPLLWAHGADVFNEDMTKCTLNLPQAVECYEKLVDLIQGGYAPNATQLQAVPANQMFSAGQLGMFFDGPYSVNSFGEAAQETDLRFGVACVPAGASFNTIMYLDGYCVPKGAKYPEIAFQVLKEILSAEAGMVVAEKSDTVEVPLNLELLEKARPSMYKYLETDEEKAVFFDAINYARPFPFNSSWNKCMDAAIGTFDLMAIGNVGVQEGLDKVASDIDAVLAE
jgi:multiple sugar transport system substrate-binding protein